MIPPLDGNLNHYCIDTVKGNHIFPLRYVLDAHGYLRR